jgi:gamma-glutamylputrescine oxidase
MSLNLLYANDTPGRHAASYYAATANPQPQLGPLDGDVTCDVCIIGAGFTGLSAALHLAARGADVVVLEAHRVGWGASGRNGGQVGTGQRLSQTELEKMLGHDDARKLWGLGQASKDIVKDLITQHGIDCDFRPGMPHSAHRERYVEGYRHYAEKLNREYDYEHIRFVDGPEMRQMLGTTAYHGGSLDMDAGHLHPLNFAIGLARAATAAGARIHDMTEVQRYEKGSRARIVTTRGTVSADTVVLACNGYLGGLEPRVANRVMPINNYVIATEPLGEEKARSLIRDDVAVSDSKFVVNYYRLSADHRMLFGGRESYSYRFPADIKSFVRQAMIEIYPQLADARIEYGWGGTLAITMNRMPHLARLEPNVYSASGYSGHGVAMATLAGKLLADAIHGEADGFNVMEKVPTLRFPGGPMLRWPLLVLAMSWYSMRDRI